jgi:hypothetical protein
LDRVDHLEKERVFIPSPRRMIAMHTGVIVTFSLLGLLFSISFGFLYRKPVYILIAIVLLSLMDIGSLVFFTLLYAPNRKLFSIKIDAVSVTGPCRFCSRSILRSEIDPARSMRRNLIDRFMYHWPIRDAEGNAIAISGLDFSPDEIVEILKTVGLDPP